MAARSEHCFDIDMEIKFGLIPQLHSANAGNCKSAVRGRYSR